MASVKYPLFLSDFNEKIIFENMKYQISWKSVQWEPSCSMRTDGRTDTTDLIVAFRNFAKAPNNTLHICSYNRMYLFTFFLTHIFCWLPWIPNTLSYFCWLPWIPNTLSYFCWLPWIPNTLSYLLRIIGFSKNLLIYFDQNATDYTSQYFVHILQ